MARSRAVFTLDYFDDPDVIGLSADADRLYMRLVISPTLSQAGTGPWQPRQLLRQMPDLDEARIDDAAEELQEVRFVFVDTATDELFVRPLMRRDGVAAQHNVFASACRTSVLTRSQWLREEIGRELLRIRRERYSEPPNDELPKSYRTAWTALRDALPALVPNAPEDPYEPFPENPSKTSREGFTEKGSRRTPGGGGGGGGGGNLQEVVGTGSKESPRARENLLSDERPTGRPVPSRGWTLIRQTIPQAHPQAVREGLALQAGALLKSGTPEPDVTAALALWLDKPHAGPGLLPSLVSEIVKSRDRPATSREATRSRPRGHDPSDWLDPTDTTSRSYVDATPTTLELEP